MTPGSLHAIAAGDLVDGRYRVISLLAEGGMGAVFLAEHTGLSKEVALKVIHSHIAGDGDVRARFAREAMASAQIDHPHVASALDRGELPDGSAYLVMPLIRGPSLFEALSAGPMPWPRAVAIAAQIADALRAAHAAGIVHRDLKPENVVLTLRDDGRDHVKVLDFGVAGLSHTETTSDRPLTRAGMVMGTPGYMSPEQAVGELVDTRTDLYSLGVILWESVVGRRLFDGPDIASIVKQQLTTVVTPIASLDAKVPPELDVLVSQLLCASRDHRPRDAASVRDALVAAIPWMRPSLVDSLPTAHESSRSVALQTESIGLATTLHGAPDSWDTRRARPGLAATRDWIARWPRGIRVAMVTLPVLLVAGFAMRPAPRVAGRVVSRPPSRAVVAAEATSDIVQTPRGPVIVERTAAAPSTATPVVLDARIESAIEALMSMESRSDRQVAANTIVTATTTPVPEYARALARIELAQGCTERRAALESIAEIGDARALPFVARLNWLPRSGCGRRGRDDCHACTRTQVANAMHALGGGAR